MPYPTNAYASRDGRSLHSHFFCVGTATATAGPIDTLTSALSKGYTSSNCSTQQVSDVQGSFGATCGSSAAVRTERRLHRSDGR